MVDRSVGGVVRAGLSRGENVAMVRGMTRVRELETAPADRSYLPSHVPSGAALLALRLSEEARGIRGLDLLRRSVDRAPPV